MLTEKVLKSVLYYDPNNGKLFWRHRPREYFKSEGSCIRWNQRYSGKEAFTYTHKNGYKMGAVFNKSYRAHTIIWILLYGKKPSGYIDHINGDRSDNRKINLRDVNPKESARNVGLSKTNKSGRVGVHKCLASGYWVAQIKDLHGKTVHLGSFISFEDACRCREESEQDFGYHENHGQTREKYSE